MAPQTPLEAVSEMLTSSEVLPPLKACCDAQEQAVTQHKNQLSRAQGAYQALVGKRQKLAVDLEEAQSIHNDKRLNDLLDGKKPPSNAPVTKLRNEIEQLDSDLRLLNESIDQLEQEAKQHQQRLQQARSDLYRAVEKVLLEQMHLTFSTLFSHGLEPLWHLQQAASKDGVLLNGQKLDDQEMNARPNADGWSLHTRNITPRLNGANTTTWIAALIDAIRDPEQENADES